MSRLSKTWLLVVCLASYFFLGQAGCQTLTSQEDITYMRSDVVRMRHDIEEIKKSLNSPATGANQDILRGQASQREALIELHEGQQRLESQTEETSHQVESLNQEMTNLKLNLTGQMEALRTSMRAQPAQTAPQSPALSTPFTNEQQAMPVQPSPELSPSVSAPAAPQVPSVPSVSPPAVPPVPSLPAAPSAPSTPAVSDAGTAEGSAGASRPTEIIDYTRLYDTAYEDYVRQSYSLARSEFEEYLRRFPETDLADNAEYWIGECFYAEGKYQEAADTFKKVIDKYPTGNKVPRAMLKAGYALLQLERNAEARAMFQQVVDAYPLSSEADQAKIKLRALQ
jgi:tol-pal system protein YbgF